MTLSKKEEDPIGYIEDKIRRIKKNSKISQEDKDLLKVLSESLFLINKKLYEIVYEEPIGYGIESFDTLYDLILNKKSEINKKAFEEVVSSYQRLAEKLEETQIFLSLAEHSSNRLEAKVICDELVKNAKKDGINRKY